MRKILVVGAGQSGLQFAIGLLAEGYDVTLITPSGPEEVRAGRVRSSQCLFGPALRRERRHGLALWDDEAPLIEGVAVHVADPFGTSEPDVSWVGHLEEPAQSVDQRVKMSTWMELFTQNGGTLVRHRVEVADLERIGPRYDLVVVAAGHSRLSEIFARNDQRSSHRGPQRSLTLAYLAGVPDNPRGRVLDRTSLTGIGEVFTLPTHSSIGPCHALLVEAVPGGPMESRTEPGASSEEVLAGVLDVLRRHVPWEYERFADARPIDPMATLQGAYNPVVREPVARLDNGTLVLGMADTVVANDPITAQGANMASLCAEIYRRAVVDHGGLPFDERFMRSTFASYWWHARQVTAWSKVLLTGPRHVWDLYRLAEQHQETADRFANSFSDPTELIDWFLHPERAMQYIDDVRRKTSSKVEQLAL